MELPVPLHDQTGREFLDRYNEIVANRWDNNPVLRILRYNHGIVRGANIYATILVDTLLRAQNGRTATMADIEMVARTDVVTFKDFYIFPGLVFYSVDENDGHNRLAADLACQLEKYGVKADGINAVVLPVSSLSLRHDSQAPDGLAFDIVNPAALIKSTTMIRQDWEGEYWAKYWPKDVDAKTGLPTKTEDYHRTYAPRTMITAGSGLPAILYNSELNIQAREFNWIDYNHEKARILVVGV